MEKLMDEACQSTVRSAQAVIEQDPEEEQEGGWERALVVVTSDEHEGSLPRSSTPVTA